MSLMIVGDVWAVVHHDTNLSEGKQQQLNSAIVIHPDPPAPEELRRIMEVMD